MVKLRDQYPLPDDFAVAMTCIDLPTQRLGVTGVEWFVPRKDRGKSLRGQFMIRTEPENEVDENAVAVFIGRRQIGYLRSYYGARYTPLLCRLGYSLAVRGEQVGDEFTVQVPDSLLLRKFLDWEPMQAAPRASGITMWRADRRVAEWRATV